MKWAINKNTTVGFGLALATLAAISISAGVDLFKGWQNPSWIERSTEVIVKTETIIAELKAAETEKRGYLITGENSYLQQYKDTDEKIDGNLEDLRQLTSDNPNQQRQLEKLEAAIAAHRAEQKQAIAMQEKELQIAEDKQNSEKISSLAREIGNEEKQGLQKRSQQEKTRAKTTNLIALLGSFIAFGLVVRANGRSNRDVQDRQQIQEDLRKYSNIFENIPLGVAIGDRSQTLQMTNPAFAQMHGYDVEELIGKPILDVFAPECRAEVAEQFRIANLKGRYSFESKHVRKDETVFPVSLDATVIKDGDGRYLYRIDSIQDISDRKQTEEALRESEQRFRQLAENIREVFWMSSSDKSQILYVSPAYEEIWGRSCESLHAEPRDFVLAIHPDDRERVRAAEEKQIGGKYDEEYRIVRPNGEIRWIRDRAFPVGDKTGEVYRLAGIAEDITERKHLEEALRKESEKLAEANHLKDQFLAIASHELRTPLSAMLGWAQLLRTGKFDEAATMRALEIIERNAKLQNQLIEDLLDISRVSCGKVQLEVSSIELKGIIAAAIDTVRTAAYAKNIQLDFIAETSPILIAGDGKRLQQVVWNLLSNAIKFTPADGRIEIRLSVEIGQKAAMLKQNLPIPYAQIQVSDTGSGIDAEFLPHVFEMFRQAQNKNTRSKNGLGLGLAIVRHLVELHGGTIHAESLGVGQGSTFTVNLPIAENSRKGQKQASTEEETTSLTPSGSFPLAGVQVLVVEDDPDTRELIATVLEEYGARVTATASVKAALKVLECNKPDVLLSDIAMPEEDGYSLIRKVQALEAMLGKIPAAALTAHASEQDCRRSLREGFQMHLSKPVEPKELAEVVASLAGRSY